MEQMLDRRNALKMGLLATVGFGALSRVADASTGLQSQNEAVVGRWFTDFWGKTYNPTVVDEIAAPDMLLKYSLHKPRHGREDIKDGKIIEENGLDDGVTALTQLGLPRRT